MVKKAKLPMGIEDFERIRKDGFYYIDKTRLMKDILEHMAYVNLFTRPRRFGKTLNMSMLKCFFEIGGDSTLFDGLEISREKELCEEYMGKFPVISISLKSAEGDTVEQAKKRLRSIIGYEAVRFPFLAAKDSEKLKSFCQAFQENNIVAIEEGFNAYLKKTISIRDTNVRKEMKENFYHGILLGLFGNMDGWNVKSNAESGEGYSDISVEIEDKEIGIVIELKYAENAAFDDGCREALKQINDRNYEETLIDDGMSTICKYGIACYKKRCRVVSG